MCTEVEIQVYNEDMRTNIVIDDELMAKAQKLAGTATKRETVDLALRELVQHRSQLGILDLAGKIEWIGDLDDMRRGRTFE
jgi:Arc/MetJ family transcription regulator